jgi:opacity protein-like surface antigen
LRFEITPNGLGWLGKKMHSRLWVSTGAVAVALLAWLTLSAQAQHAPAVHAGIGNIVPGSNPPPTTEPPVDFPGTGITIYIPPPLPMSDACSALGGCITETFCKTTGSPDDLADEKEKCTVLLVANEACILNISEADSPNLLAANGKNALPDDRCKSSHLGGPVSPLSVSAFGFDGGLDALSTRGSGYRVSDTAGLLGPNALTPGYRLFESGGSVKATLDATRFFDLNANQQLWFGLTGDLHSANMVFSASGLTPGGPNAHAASAQSDIYTVTGSANYSINNFYLSGSASFDTSHLDFTNNLSAPGAQGSTNGRGYSLDATAGALFPLFSTGGINPATITKAPPKTATGYALFLDTSGHIGYSQESDGAFVDSTGFAYGAQQLSFGDIGAEAKLMAIVPDRSFAWAPFVGVTYDHYLGLQDTFSVPSQTAIAADTFNIVPANNFWGAELGLSLLNSGGATFGVKAFYQASADTQTVGGSAYMKIPLWDFAMAAKDSGIRVAGSGSAMPLKAKAPPVVPWTWAGLYLGGHVGGALAMTDFADPFGPSVFGDKVRSPGFLGGGQIGYNWQPKGSRWVLGTEADLSLMSSDGDATCFEPSATVVGSTCRVQPRATATLTGRVGYALGPDGRTLVYGKGGLAWADESIGMTLNDAGENFIQTAALATVNGQTGSLWGWTLGVGVEHAITPAWSIKVEYDFLDFGSRNVANIGNVAFTPVFLVTTATPPGTSAVSQNIQEVKLGLNYKWGADPSAPGWRTGPAAYALPQSDGWEIEGGGRYFGSVGQFHKDFGNLVGAGQPITSDLSRLNYGDMQTNSGEFFGRIDTPWNVFVKGYVGGGITNGGNLNDEDWVLPLPGELAAYSDTLSPAVNGNIAYGAIDAGYDVLRGRDYKVGVFGGYFAFNQQMSAFGCTAIASVNCTPPVPASGSPVVTENDKWSAVRVGMSAETMLTDRVKISADVAYLPWVRFNGTDQHFVGNTGTLAEIFPANANGSGVQVEATLSYYLTPQWSVGVGGRYWGLWTSPSGQFNCTFGCAATPTAPQYFRAQVEQIGAFVQTSYRFDWNRLMAAN